MNVQHSKNVAFNLIVIKVQNGFILGIGLQLVLLEKLTVKNGLLLFRYFVFEKNKQRNK